MVERSFTASQGSEKRSHSEDRSAGTFQRNVCAFWLRQRCFALDVALVGEVVSVDVLIRVPLSRPSVRGIFNLRGTPVPLSETPVKGEYVAGVRYRAWSPPSALHPTLGKDVPLVFDIVDTWNNRAIGGCTYHVAHPGGRNYDTFPVNAFEAEGRRISRFWSEGHTQGPVTPRETFVAGVGRYLEKNEIPRKFDPPAIKVSPEYPHTLDLRQF